LLGTFGLHNKKVVYNDFRWYLKNLAPNIKIILKTTCYRIDLNIKEQKIIFYLHEIPCVFFLFITFPIE